MRLASPWARDMLIHINKEHSDYWKQTEPNQSNLGKGDLGPRKQ